MVLQLIFSITFFFAGYLSQWRALDIPVSDLRVPVRSGGLLGNGLSAVELFGPGVGTGRLLPEVRQRSMLVRRGRQLNERGRTVHLRRSLVRLGDAMDRSRGSVHVLQLQSKSVGNTQIYISPPPYIFITYY